MTRPRMSAIETLSLFDDVARSFVNLGNLSETQRRILDEALVLHADACAKLKLDPNANNAARVMRPTESHTDGIPTP